LGYFRLAENAAKQPGNQHFHPILLKPRMVVEIYGVPVF